MSGNASDNHTCRSASAAGAQEVAAMPKRAKTILLVEDLEDDEVLFKVMARRAGLVNPLLVVRDGAEAVAYFKGEGRFADRKQYPLPELVLLDLRLPKMDGLEVLQWVRRQPEFTQLPVVILTGSILEEDRHKATELGANWYVEKPCDITTLNSLAEHWPAVWLKRNN